MDRNRTGLRKGRAVEREEARRRIKPLLHNWRARALKEGCLHLLRNDVETVADHLERDRVEAVGPCHGMRVRSRSSAAPRKGRAVQPGGRSVVVSSCSMTAGPAITSPPAISARSWISVRTAAEGPG